MFAGEKHCSFDNILEKNSVSPEFISAKIPKVMKKNL